MIRARTVLTTTRSTHQTATVSPDADINSAIAHADLLARDGRYAALWRAQAESAGAAAAAPLAAADASDAKAA